MATVKAKAFKLNDQNRAFLQSFIVEQIPDDTIYVLASSEGYLFFNEDVGRYDLTGTPRMPHLIALTYYEIEFEA